MIAFCHLLNDNSGSPIVLRQAIRTFVKGNDQNLLFVGSQGRGCLEGAGVPIRRYWYRRSRFKVVTLVTLFASQVLLYRALTRAKLPKSTIIYVNTLLPFGAAIWAHRKGYRLVYHAHEVSISPLLFRKFLVTVVERTASLVIYVSVDHCKRLPIVGVPSTVLHNAIAPEIYEKGLITLYSPRRSKSFNVLMLASPRDMKGLPEFFMLAASLRDRGDIRFTLVLNAGDDEICPQITAAEQLKNVEVYPRTDSPEAFYKNADVLLNLSRVDQWIETFGLTLVEGMSFGLPVIAPPFGGPAEIITHGQDGYLIDSRDVEKLKRSIVSLADDPSVAMSISVAARARANDFTVEKFDASLKALIDPIVNLNI